MGLFTKKPKKTGVELLQEKSGNIMNVFTRTVTELQTVNTDIDGSVTSLNEARNQIDKDISDLNILRMKNEKVIFNIQKFIE